jgi:AraC family transcriptional regulator of adaptative response / DNA-3-methyladenine glycosylase II
VTGVRTTGIYCRPSCPATTPNRANVAFYPSAAAAQLAGFRACKRCRPDATPGSPAWNSRADLVARAMRLIADGVVDREGVAGLAQRLHYSARHLDRLLMAEVGAGPLGLARAQRAHTARTLIETTDLALTEVAFAAGFASVRQFNDTIRVVFADTPTNLRTRGADTPASSNRGTISLRLPHRRPFDGPSVLGFLAARAVPGVERATYLDSGAGEPAADIPAGVGFARVLDLPHGSAVLELAADPAEAYIRCSLRMADWRDLATAVARGRRLLDLDADPVAIDQALARDPLLAPLVAAHPGRRAPAFADGAEGLVRAFIGQQVSVAGARTIAGRLAAAYGRALAPELTEIAEPGRDGSPGNGTAGVESPGLALTFPRPDVLAEIDPSALPMPGARARALVNCCAELASGSLVIDVGADPEELRRQLLARPGIGEWTADYVTMRALGHPDVFLPTDLGIRRSLEMLSFRKPGAGGTGTARTGVKLSPRSIADRAATWSPWRSYAVHHLWGALDDMTRPDVTTKAEEQP